MKMNTPKMTIKREQTLDLYEEHFEEAARELYARYDLNDFNADDICDEVLTATDIDAQDWFESLTDESRCAIVTTMQEYFEEYILKAVRDNFNYIMKQNDWTK